VSCPRGQSLIADFQARCPGRRHRRLADRDPGRHCGWSAWHPEGRPVTVRVLEGNTADPAAFRQITEITSLDFPGEWLSVCRNPALADERARKREALLTDTGKLLAPVIARVAAGRLSGADKIGTAVGKVIGKYKDG